MESAMDKYEELYNLSKYLLNHEIDRQKRLDEKASKYLAVITLLVGGYGFFANHLLNEIIPLKQWGFLEWALGVAVVLVLAALFITWVIIFKSLKIIELRHIPMNDEMITFFDTHRPVDICYALLQFCPFLINSLILLLNFLKDIGVPAIDGLATN
jgi:hypothetical protein